MTTQLCDIPSSTKQAKMMQAQQLKQFEERLARGDCVVLRPAEYAQLREFKRQLLAARRSQ